MLPAFPRNLGRYQTFAWMLVKHMRADMFKPADDIEPQHGVVNPDVEKAALALTADLEKMGPTFVKFGQLLSGRPDLISPAYLKALERLQDHVQPIPFEQVEQIIKEEFDAKISHLFAEFDRKPLASASLGQVHRAKLHNGADVAVKIRRPDIRDGVISDLDALDHLAGWSEKHNKMARRLEFRRVVKVLRQTLLMEMDFRNELANLALMRESLKEYHRLVVPITFDDYCTPRVLTMMFIQGKKCQDIAPLELLSDERRQLAEELFKAYLEQILVAGVIHCDPHPGNLLFTPDKRIALIDMGLILRLSPRMREHMMKLLMAIAEGRGEEAADIFLRIGTKTGRFNPELFRAELSRLVTKYQDASIERAKFGEIVLEMQLRAHDNGVTLPEEILLISKTLLHLEDTLLTLDPQFRMHETVRKHTLVLIERRSLKIGGFGQFYSGVLEAGEFASYLPRRLNKILDLVAENQLSVEVNAIDERRLIAGMQKIANRITIGLLLASLIVGASLMMQLESEKIHRTFGYPTLAVAFFLLAAVGALGLIIRIAFFDHRDSKKGYLDV